MVLEGAGDADDLLSAADAAMYAVKRAGKGGYGLFDPGAAHLAKSGADAS